ncbi:L-rhamnose/proton symporter RhaT [Neorhodopirellula pilleata]|uniref:L-rhamnose-proton symporter n=1 Tax=Neorhodopirellula pilleata TaxID=2714738 RepID=A0A5C6AV65_9BACT|nr:L-rhamnose/proton symporter RhaT [Neorhodopirellula pilleata]TWU03099.1 L-rhamnose-proton symporter [Neorhodopirellula pilleata]
MITNPSLGILLHAMGGLAAGSFYAPLKRAKAWHWESSWLVMGSAAWLIVPWFVASATTSDLIGVLRGSPRSAWLGCVGFGMLWGLGNLTFGLSVRYLGMALGYSIALGFCMVFGTLMPPIASGQMGAIVSTRSGLIVLSGVFLCLVGISLCGVAGMRKEAEAQANPFSEFAMKKGFLVASMAGVLSACFAFGLAAGKPIADQAKASGTAEIFSNNAVLVVILLGGLASNACWCIYLNIKNRSYGDYLGKYEESTSKKQFSQYGLSILGGLIWYFQFFFYGMGTTKLGEQYDFSSWTIHMSFVILFSSLWGIVFHEWQGTSATTKAYVWAGLIALTGSTVLIGFGNSVSS